MDILLIDVILTIVTILCFVVLGTHNLMYFHKRAPNMASYALGMSHLFVAVSMIFRLIPMVADAPLIIGWTGRVIRTLSYLYLAYAFILIAMPCHVPLFRALSCPFCSLDLLEPRRCKQSTLRVLFIGSVICVTLCSLILLGGHPEASDIVPSTQDGYFWYASHSRLPLGIGMVHLIIQTAACGVTALLVMNTFSHLWAMVIVSISRVLGVVGYAIYIFLGLLEVTGELYMVKHIDKFTTAYTIIQLASTILYLIPITWLTLWAEQNLFSIQKYNHLLMMRDRLSVYTNMMHQSIQNQDVNSGD